MSSIPQKKEAFLLRSASLQKIRCSANRLQGSIFSKESSIIHHLKSTISTSRSSLPLVSALLSYIRILSVAMASWAQLIVKCGEIPISKKSSRFIIGSDDSPLKHQSTSEIKTKLLAAETVKFLVLLASHMCMFMIYIQLGLLVYLVSLTQLKIGFIFLLACIGVIHVLVSEISFMNKKAIKSPRQSRRAQRTNSQRQIQKTQTDNEKEKKL